MQATPVVGRGVQGDGSMTHLLVGPCEIAGPAKRPAPVIGWRGARGAGAALAASLLQSRAQLLGLTDGLAYPVFGPPGTL